ncbi:Uncharacterised protein [Yersinia kristensenii]|uniref:Uncharacterized protein n=1 Tax=Yersinia kristensenii TaxID=28152 RepID=A0A0T9M4R2_YERKR|nr:Uncharacterised protein [Yersinia kristensenii]
MGYAISVSGILCGFIFTEKRQLTAFGNIKCIGTIKINSFTYCTRTIGLALKRNIPFNR